jgi:hypothetical protein
MPAASAVRSKQAPWSFLAPWPDVTITVDPTTIVVLVLTTGSHVARDGALRGQGRGHDARC